MWKGFAQFMADVHFDASNQATIARAARKRKGFDDDSYNSWSVEESAVGPSRDESGRFVCINEKIIVQQETFSDYVGTTALLKEIRRLLKADGSTFSWEKFIKSELLHPLSSTRCE